MLVESFKYTLQTYRDHPIEHITKFIFDFLLGQEALATWLTPDQAEMLHEFCADLRGSHSFFSSLRENVEDKLQLVKEATVRKDLELVTSATPENKYGPNGYDLPEIPLIERIRSISPVQKLNYKIDFWNKETATAPAQDVYINDTLDSDLNWTSFRFEEIGFLNWTVRLEPTQYFNVYVDLRPASNLIVTVKGTFNPSNGQINWLFKSLDPGTLQAPEDALAGFLPPITENGTEIGWVCFSADKKEGLPSGTRLENQAFVNFDGVGPWNPAPKDAPFLNTVDSKAPTSSLSAKTEGTNIELAWNSNDDAGSGVRDYSIYLSKDDGAFEVWLSHVTNNSVVFAGEFGHKYALYSVAEDNVGNIEEVPQRPDVTIALASGLFDGLTPMYLGLFVGIALIATVSAALFVRSRRNSKKRK
jgi:hypothetical protein